MISGTSERRLGGLCYTSVKEQILASKLRENMAENIIK